MRLGRTRFAREIVAEYYKPAKESSKVIIFCSGAPGIPTNQKLVEFYGKKGYWVFYPRYRGTWESGGKFLKKSLDRDILDIVDQLPKGFRDSYTGKTMKLNPSKIFLLGGSFGGPAMILASRDKRITKAVLRGAVVDWRAPSKDEPLDWLEGFMKDAFGGAYRFDHKDWVMLSKGKFYNPIAHIKEIDGSKLLFLHAKDDTIVHYKEVKEFAEAVGSRLITFPRGGHLRAKLLTTPKYYKIVKEFFK